MFRISLLDVFAALAWAVGVVLTVGAITARVLVIPTAAVFCLAGCLTVIAYLHRILTPIRQSIELAGAVVRLNGHRSPERV